VGWPTAEGVLLGFSHGIAGIAWTLLDAAAGVAGSRRARLTDTALAALTHERSLFDAAEGNWPYLRLPEHGGAPRFAVSWCHGAPGIALGRALGLRWNDDPQTRDEIEIAVATTLAHAPADPSLCHGSLGNLAIVARCAEVLDREDWRDAVREKTDALLADPRWPLVVQEAAARGRGPEYFPGLMTGLAGAGYGLLYLAEPQRVPLVLALDPP
jgi:lantibiotic modifying enzyme